MKCSRVSDTELISTAKKVARRALPDSQHPEIKGLRNLFAGAFISGYIFAFGVGRKRKPS